MLAQLSSICVPDSDQRVPSLVPRRPATTMPVRTMRNAQARMPRFMGVTPVAKEMPADDLSNQPTSVTWVAECQSAGDIPLLFRFRGRLKRVQLWLNLLEFRLLTN